MLKKLRVKFILMMMSFAALLLGSIFGLIYHFTAADLAQSSFEMMQAVALRPSRPERPGSAPGFGPSAVFHGGGLQNRRDHGHRQRPL